jgi:hypothetical protein
MALGALDFVVMLVALLLPVKSFFLSVRQLETNK